MGATHHGASTVHHPGKGRSAAAFRPLNGPAVVAAPDEVADGAAAHKRWSRTGVDNNWHSAQDEAEVAEELRSQTHPAFAKGAPLSGRSRGSERQSSWDPRANRLDMPSAHFSYSFDNTNRGTELYGSE